MKVAGIITEYNPFHNGHKLHIDETRRVTGADYVIAVMSGNFVQRGAPAILDKYSRAKMALNNGVDIVLELPVCYATGSAEYFALGAISLLDKLGIVDCICFGSECGDINMLTQAADLLLKAPQVFDDVLLSYLKEGFTYPAARAKMVEQYLFSSGNQEAYANISSVISEPNNILGLEYIKALKRISSTITPYTIHRQDAHYHEDNLAGVNTDSLIGRSINSATAIRKALSTIGSISDLAAIKNSVPEDVFDFLGANYRNIYPISEEDFFRIIKYKLLSENSNSLTSYVDITSDLADRIIKVTDIDNSLVSLTKRVKTKNLTHTRINRSFIHLLLNIREEAFREYIRNGYTFYARVLGLREEASHLLRRITDNSNIPVITKVAKAEEQLSSIGMQMLSEDIFATHVYNQAIQEKYSNSILNEYKHGICIL